jgi:hypothetical protein
VCGALFAALPTRAPAQADATRAAASAERNPNVAVDVNPVPSLVDAGGFFF